MSLLKSKSMLKIWKVGTHTEVWVERAEISFGWHLSILGHRLQVEMVARVFHSGEICKTWTFQDVRSQSEARRFHCSNETKRCQSRAETDPGPPYKFKKLSLRSYHWLRIIKLSILFHYTFWCFSYSRFIFHDLPQPPGTARWAFRCPSLTSLPDLSLILCRVPPDVGFP